MGRREPLHLRVVEVIPETSDACSFVLEPLDAADPVAYRPGQFLTVRVSSEQTGTAARSYSLSSAPGHGEPMKITVKRTAGGYVSNWLCDNLGVGDVLDTLPPGGVFTPPTLNDDLLLVAAGSGITPVLSILKSCLRDGGADIALLYANRDETSVIFARELCELQAEHGRRLTVTHWLESVQGVPTASALSGILAPHTRREAYICGPGPFMDLAAQTLTGLGTPADRIHTEKFVSLTADPFVAVETTVAGPASTVEVTLDGQTSELPWPATVALLDVLLGAGIEAPYSCREGSCSACACVVLQGEVKMRRNDVLEPEDIADGIVLGCQALPISDRVRVTYDQ